MKIKQLTSYPNPNEIGLGNTNETYIRIENSLNVSDIFPINTEVPIVDSKSGRTYVVKAKLERSEFRINKLGQLYRDYNFRPGDEIKFTFIEQQGNQSVFFTVTNFQRTFLSVGSKGTEIVNIEHILPFAVDLMQREFSVPINEGTLILRYEKSEKKRADSPSETDFFSTLVNDVEISKGNYYISFSEGNISIEEIKKNHVEEYLLPDDLLSDIVRPSLSLPLQQIYYGAPGTGKSHEINEQTKGEDVIRTTFHPDSDYSTFVGAYKPTSTEIAMRDVTGRVIKDSNGKDVMENRIIYEFVDQAFLQAYIKAWKNLVFNDGKKQYLVIEEINRGNCAQIFGDLFQLLDRNEWGFSDYPIQADNDMKKQLKKAFARTDEPDKQIFLQDDEKQRINDMYKGGDDVVAKVLSGECLLLPSNLYIWATMNTSDQSLFPIDSAFKRRWDWRYMPIDTEKETWKIKVNGTCYSWTSFLNIINEIVQEKTQSEDKQLGFYFCKAKNGVVDAETFVSKVLFYLWNDVFKDYGFDDDFFEDEKQADGTFKPLTFKSFYDVKTRRVIESQAEKFLKNLNVETVGGTELTATETAVSEE